jgi:hypothetical protein
VGRAAVRLHVQDARAMSGDSSGLVGQRIGSKHGIGAREMDRRIAALIEQEGRTARNGVRTIWIEPWSLKPKPEPVKKRPPATLGPIELQGQTLEERGRMGCDARWAETRREHAERLARAREIIMAVLAVHRRHGAPWERAWKAATAGVSPGETKRQRQVIREGLARMEPMIRAAYEHGPWDDTGCG